MARKKYDTRKVQYMAVTPDEYELPLYVPDTIEELAERYGISPNTIYTSISHDRSGTRQGHKFVRVKL